MTDTDVSVRFGGDLSQLQASITQAKAQMGGFAASAGTTKNALSDLNTTMDAAKNSATGLGTAFKDLAVFAGALVLAYKGAAVAGDAMTDTAESTAVAIGKGAVALDGFAAAAERSVVSGLAATIRGASSAFLDYFTNAAFADRGTRLFAQANEGARASIGRTILAVEAYANAVRLAYSSAPKDEFSGISNAGGLDKFLAALSSGTGAKDALVSFTAELEKIPGLSDEAASSIEVMLATIPNYSTVSNDILINLLQTISKTGDEALKNAKTITDAFKDTVNGGKILGDLTGQLKDLNDVQVLATRIASSLNPDQASAYFATIITKLKEQAAAQKAVTDQDVAALQRLGPIGDLLVRGIQDRIDKEKEYAAAVTVATANLTLQKNAADAITAAQQKEVEFQKLLNDETTRTSQLETAQSNISSLKSRQRRTGSDGDGIKPDETKGEFDLLVRTMIAEAANQGEAGMAAVAAVIKNRVDSGYGGQDSYEGVIKAPRQFSAWNPGDAAGAMANSVSADSDIYKRAADIARKMVEGEMDDPTNGATSYYNPKGASPAWGKTMTNQSQIGDHVFGNTPDSPPVLGGDDQDKITQRLQEQNDLVKRLNDEKAGGNATDQAQLAIAQNNVTAAKDEVADAEKLVAARKLEVEQSKDGTPEKQAAAQKALAEAEISLREKVSAVSKAAAELDAQQYEATSRKKMEILNAELTKEQAGYAVGSAKYDELQRQKLENTKKVTDAEKADAASAEDAKYDALLRKSKESQELVQEQARVGEISHAQELASLRELLAQEASDERAHFTTLATIWGQGTQQYRKAIQARTEVDAKAHQQEVAAANTANTQIYNDYKSSFERIGSTVSSSLMAILERTGTFRQLLQNVAKQIVSMFLEAGVKMVADWAARQAAQVAITVLGETQKTAAVAAGTAARESLSLAGLASSASATVISILKSITASAAETFAGIFGFLSPVMGPAAAGPAAAGQAAVLGVGAGLASFAVGSWSLPGDMVAQVHRGEMIVPAAATPWAQSLMANAAGGSGNGGSGGGNIHNWNISALDAQSVVALFKNNGRQIAKIVSDIMKSSPSMQGR